MKESFVHVIKKAVDFLKFGWPAIAAFFLSIWITSLVVPEELVRDQRRAILHLVTILVILGFVLIHRQKKRILQVFTKFNIFLNAYGRLVYRLSAVFITYLILLLILFFSINHWPEKFHVSQELKERNFQYEVHQAETQVAEINQRVSFLKQEKIELSYLYREIIKAKQSDSVMFEQFANGFRLFVNDSIIMASEYPFFPPGTTPTFNIIVYDRFGKRIKHISFDGRGDLEKSFHKRLSQIESRLTKSSMSISQLKSRRESDMSLLSFISYYSNNQLQPLASSMKVICWLADRIDWLLLVVMASEVIAPVFRRLAGK